MKRMLCAAVALLVFLAAATAPPARARAYDSFGRAIERDVGFYKDPQASELLFYLPFTYYVRIAEKGETVSRAELFAGDYSTPAIDGYVYTDSLYYDGTSPETPYCELTLTTAAPAGFYADAAATVLVRHIFENRALKFYGYTYDAEGNYVYFVDYNGELGYVREECVVPFEIAPHPAPLPQPEEPETPQTPETPPEGGGALSTGLKIAVIVALVLAVAVILAFSVRPHNKKPEEPFEENYSDNEYR